MYVKITKKSFHLPNWRSFKSNQSKGNGMICQRKLFDLTRKRKMHFQVKCFLLLLIISTKNKFTDFCFFLCIYILLITLNLHKHWWIIVKYIYWVATKRVKDSDVSHRLATDIFCGTQKQLEIFLRIIHVLAICCYTTDCFCNL